MTTKAIRACACAAVSAVLGLGCLISAPRAAAATAGSLAYLLGGNVWVSATDGSGAREVTTDGSPGDPYLAVSEDAAGVVYAVRHSTMYRLRHDGQAVAPAIGLSPSGEGWVAPDGLTLATDVIEPNGIGFVHSTDLTRLDTGATAPEGYELGRATWVNDSTVVGEQACYPAYQVYGSSATSWNPFGPAGEDFCSGPISATGDGTRVAARGGESDSNLLYVTETGGFGTAMTDGCRFTWPADGSTTPADDRVAFSADGDQVWFDRPDGIETFTLGAGPLDCSAINATGTTVVPGARAVAYSTAGVDAEAPLPASTPTPTPTPTPAPSHPATPKAPATGASLAAKGTVLHVTLAQKYHGRKVVLWVRGAHNRWIKVATMKLNGKAASTLKLSKALRKKIKHGSRLRFYLGKKIVATFAVH